MKGNGPRVALGALVLVVLGVGAWLSGIFDPATPPAAARRDGEASGKPDTLPSPEAPYAGGAAPAVIGTVPFNRESDPADPAAQPVFGSAGDSRLTGKVLVGEKPFPGATVDLLDDSASGFSGMVQLGDLRKSVVSGADGEFAFSELYPGEKCILRVTHKDYVACRVTGIDAAQPSTLRQIIRLETGLEISGTVRDKDGRAVAGVEIAIYDVALNAFDPEAALERSAVSASDGTYRSTGIGKGNKRVEARKPGFTTETAPPLALETSKSGIDFIVVPGPSIQGIARSAAGAPVKNARIAAREVFESGMQRPRTAIPRTLSARSRDDGTFSVDGLVAGTFEVWASGAGHLESPRVRTLAGSTGVVLELRAAAGISGRIVDTKTGVPIPSGVVILAGTPEFLVMIRGRVVRVNDAQGSFQLVGVAAGTYYLVARADGYAEHLHGPVSVGEGQALAGVEIKLGPGARLRGQVIDPTGAPIEGVKIAAGRQVGRALASSGLDAFKSIMTMNATSVAAVSGPDGRYVLTGLRDGTWQITPSHPRLATDKTIMVEVVKDVDRDIETLTLAPGGTVKGMVKTPSGAPDTRAKIMIQHLRYPDIRRELSTGAGGTFQAEGLPAGDYRITVREREGAMSFADVILQSQPNAKTWTIRAGETLEANL